MNDNTSIAIVLSIFFLSVAGWCTMDNYQVELTRREMEKTKQIQIQARIDSMQVVTSNLYGK